MEDGNATHLPVLEKIFEHKKFNSILEYGCGMYSTPFFKAHTKKLTSVDRSNEWLQKAGESLPKEGAVWTPVGVHSEFEAISLLRQWWDLIFIDGGAALDRHGIAQVAIALESAPIVVVHDGERVGYFYHLVCLPPEWYAIRVETEMPWTIIFTADISWKKVMQEYFQCTIYNSTEMLVSMKFPNIKSYQQQQAEKLAAGHAC